MAIKRIIAFGDSWTFGDELLDPQFSAHPDKGILDHYTENTKYRLDHCFAGLVANHYGVELENLAFPGSSLESMRWTVDWLLNNNDQDLQDSLWLVGLTDSSRQSWFNPLHEVGRKDPPWNRHMHGTWLTQPNPDIDDNWFELQKLWLVMSYHREWSEYNYRQTINLFDYAANKAGAKLLQFSVLGNNWKTQSPTLLYPGMNWRSILQNKQKELSTELFAEKGHPNEKGHEIISKHLIEHIKYANIIA
jgi:hypothetical protein